jgi:hypothetical protein
MIKVYSDIKIQLPVNGEYSVDSGVTWTPLTANTQVIIAGSSLAQDAVVKVRSTNAVTTLDKVGFGLPTTKYDTFNIKQAQNVTNLDNFFNGAIIKKARIGSLPTLTSMIGTFKNSTCNDVLIESNSSLNNVSNMFETSNIERLLIKKQQNLKISASLFYAANIKEVSSISFPKCISGNSFMNGATINVLGRIDLGSEVQPNATDINGNLDYSYAFKNLDLYSGASIDIKTSSYNGYVGSFYATLDNVKCPYLLGSNFKVDAKSQTLNFVSNIGYFITRGSNLNPAFQDLNLVVESQQTYAVENTYSIFFPVQNRKRFSLFNSIKVIGFKGKYDLLNINSVFYVGNQSFNAVDTRWIAKYGSSSIVENSSGLFNAYTTASDYDIQKSIPEFYAVRESSNGALSLVGSNVYFGYDGFKTVKFENLGGTIIKNVTDYAERIENVATKLYSVATNMPTEIVYFSRNGYKACLDGTNIKLYDETETLVTTITGITNFKGAYIHEDGYAVGIATGGDKTAGTTTVTTIKEYKWTDGSEIHHGYVENAIDEVVVGIYRSNRNSKLNVVQSLYTGGTLTSSTVKNFNGFNDPVNTTTMLSPNMTDGYYSETTQYPVDYVTNIFTEDAEFLCVNRTTGAYIRYFTR